MERLQPPKLSRRAVLAAPFVLAAPVVLASGAARAQQEPIVVRLALDGRLQGAHAPLCVAIDRAHFMMDGLTVVMEPSAHAAEAMAKVIEGRADMALGDLPGLCRYLDDNRQSGVRAVGILCDRMPYAVAGRRSKDIGAYPASLIGKTLGGTPFEGGYALWPLFARINGLEPTAVSVETLGLNVREPALLSGEVDGIFGNAAFLEASLKARGLPASELSLILYAANGLDLYSSALVVSERMQGMAGDPCRHFLRAMTKGWRDCLADPAAAAAAVVRRDGLLNVAVVTEHISALARDYVVSERVKAQGFGTIEPSRFQDMVATLSSLRPFKAPLALQDVFKADLLPTREERMIT